MQKTKRLDPEQMPILGHLLGILLHGVAVCTLLWGMAQAQTLQIPDAVSLTDVRFFRDSATGRQYNDALAMSEKPLPQRIDAFLQAYQHARKQFDFEAQGICGSELASCYLKQGNIAEAFDWVNRCLSLDSLIPALSPIRQRMHRNLAGIYTDIDAHQLALPHYRLALAIDQQRDPADTPRRFRHCSSLAIGFQNAGQMDSAIHYFRQGIEITNGLPEPLWKSSALNNYGMAQQSAGSLDSALATYTRAYATLPARRAEELEFATSVRDNLGSVLLQLGRSAEALALFMENWNDSTARLRRGASLQAGIRVTRTLVVLGRGPEAMAWLSQAHAFASESPVAVQERYRKDFLEAGIEVHATLGQWEQASRLQASLLAYQDSLLNNSLRVKMTAVEAMLLDKTAHFKTELTLLERAAADARSRSRFQTLLIVSGSLLAILLLGLVILNARRRAERIQAVHQQEAYRREVAELGLKNERLENAQLSQELEMKKRDITDYALVYSLRRKIFEEILADLKRIKRSPHPEKSVQELIIALKGKVEGQEKPHLEATNIEQVNHAFFEKLKQAFPGLSASELELCGMLRLGYSSKDVASLRNIAPSSVRIAKTRLKKKMDLGPEMDLKAFLDGL